MEAQFRDDLSGEFNPIVADISIFTFPTKSNVSSSAECGEAEAENERRLRLSAADKGRVLIIQLVRNVFQAGLGGNESDFVDERAAPRLVDASAKFALHFFELLLPRFALRGDFEAPDFAADGTRPSGEGFADDARPSSGEPRKRGLRPLKPAHDSAKKITRSFHGSGDSNTRLPLWVAA
jgi:hypothetical protein